MITKDQKTNVARSISALALAVLIIVGSFLTVAAAVHSNDGSEVIAKNSPMFEQLNNDGAFHVLAGYEVTVKNGEEEKTILVTGGTVAEAVESAGVKLEKNQVTSPSLRTTITEDVTIEVLNGKKVSVTVDGETKNVLLPYGKVADSLEAAGFKLSKNDVLSVDREQEIADTKEITIQRVIYKEETVSEKIPFESVTEESDELELGESKVKTKGKDGKKAVVKKVKYVDGQKESEEVVAEKVVKEAVDEVTLVGSGSGEGVSAENAAGYFTDEDGNKVAYSYMLTGESTAYSEAAGSSTTATGVDVYEGGVAVDPNLIPYGSKVYIESVDGSINYGYATAVDTGGAMESGEVLVDVFYFDESFCEEYGRRDVNLYVIS